MAAGTLNLTRQRVTNVRIPSDERPCWITGLDTTTAGQLILTDLNNSNVKLFSPDGELISSLRLSELPWDVTVVDECTAAVSMWVSSEIVILDLGPGGQLSVRRSISLDGPAREITCYKNNLIIACYGSVRMINMEGELQWSTGSPDEQLLVSGEYLTVRSGFGPATVVVSDPVKHTITVLDADSGKLIKVCDVEGRMPAGITVDNYGTVYVSYFRTREIGVWSGEMVGRYRTTLGQLDFNPWTICYSTRRELIVGGWSARIYHYKIPSFLAPSLPEEIMRMDSKSIELYKQALEDGMEEDYSIRIMVVGPFGVGKTAFTNRLLCQDVNIDERNSTDGIDVHVRRCKVSLETNEWIVDAPEKGEETLKRIAKVLGSTHKQHTDTFSNQSSEVLESDPIDGGSAVTTVDVNKDEEDLMKRTRDQDRDKLNLNTTDDDKTDDKNSSSFSPNPLKNEDMLIKELKEVVADAVNTDDPKDYAKVSVWDFGGQFVFYTTHQMFLTHRAIYILISNMSQHIEDVVIDDEPYFDCSGSQKFKIEDFIDIWLNSIHGHSKVDEPGRPPVILVGTHTDRLDDNPNQREEQIEAMFGAIRYRFAGKDVSKHFITKDFGLSNASPDPKFKELRETITEVAKKQTYWGELKPAKWIHLEKMLEDLRKNGVEIISRKTVEQLNSTLPVPITRDEELDLFLRFQHDTANIMYFSIPELRDQIVLSPQFLVNTLKSLITAEAFCRKKPEILDKWREFRQKGILRQSLLDVVWKKEENQSFHDNRDHILNLMEHLNIIARPLTNIDSEENQDDPTAKMSSSSEAEPLAKKPRLSSPESSNLNSNTVDSEQDFFLAPCMLKESPPESMFQSDGAFITTPCVCLVLGNVAFPSSIFNRLLVFCMSRWPIAKSGNKHLIYCGCGQFHIDSQHRLTLSFISNVIQLRITRYSRKDRHPSVQLCKEVLDTVKLSLRRIGKCLSLELDIKECVKCPVGGSGSTCRYSVQEIQGCEEVQCDNHDNVEVFDSVELLKYWFESEVADNTPLEQVGSEDDDSDEEKSPITQDHINYARLCNALLSVCTDALRGVLLSQVPTGYRNIYEAIRAKEKLLAGTKKKKGLLRGEQKDLVFPDSGNIGNVDQFDISLLFILIRNTSSVRPPVTGWNDPPNDNPRDRSLGASLQRIRLCRNETVGHSKDGKLDDQCFEEYWKKIGEMLDDIESVIGDKGFRKDLEQRKKQVITQKEANKLKKQFQNYQLQLQEDMQTIVDIVQTLGEATKKLQTHVDMKL